jgi:hypothetical protein
MALRLLSAKLYSATTFTLHSRVWPRLVLNPGGRLHRRPLNAGCMVCKGTNKALQSCCGTKDVICAWWAAGPAAQAAERMLHAITKDCTRVCVRGCPCQPVRARCGGDRQLPCPGVGSSRPWPRPPGSRAHLHAATRFRLQADAVGPAIAASFVKLLLPFTRPCTVASDRCAVGRR